MSSSSSKGHWHSRVRTHCHVCVSNQIFQLLWEGIDQWVPVAIAIAPFPWLETYQKQQILQLHKIKEINFFALGWQ